MINFLSFQKSVYEAKIVHFRHFCYLQFYLEPPEKLKESLKQNGLSLSEFFTLNHGKSVHLEDTETETSLGVEVKEDTETERSLGVEVKEDAADKSKI